MAKSETRFAETGDVRETLRCYIVISRRNRTYQQQKCSGAITGSVAPTGLHQYPSYPKGDFV